MTVRELIAVLVALGEQELDRRVLIEGSKYHDGAVHVDVADGYVVITSEP